MRKNKKELQEEKIKRLFRSNKDRILGGVAGGIGEYFEVDPVIIRLIWVLTLFLGGMGLIVYVIAWIIIPLRKNSARMSKDSF